MRRILNQPASWLLAGALAFATACSDTSAERPGPEPGTDGLPEQEVLASGGAASGGTDGNGTPGDPASAGAAGSGASAAGSAALASGGAAASPDRTPSPSGGAQYKYPEWSLLDVQPESNGYGQSYGLEAFRGRTVVVSLLEGFCTFCRSNGQVLEEVVGNLKGEGYDVELIVLSDFGAEQFVPIVSGPIFMDHGEGLPAWNAMRSGAVKHDTFVFAPNGERVKFIPGSYTGDANLLRSEVTSAVKGAAAQR